MKTTPTTLEEVTLGWNAMPAFVLEAPAAVHATQGLLASLLALVLASRFSVLL